MPIAYRSILQLEPSNALLDEVDGIVNDWFESKHLPRLTEPQILRLSNRQLSRADVADAKFVARRWELREVWDAPKDRRLRQLDDGAAITTVTVVQSASSAWLWIDTDSPRVERELEDGRVEVESQQSGTPRLVADFVEVLAPMDGKAEPYTGALQISATNHVAELLDVLRDDTRRGAVFVSSPPVGGDVRDWTDQINAIIRGTEGMAVGYVLSAPALLLLNSELGGRHQVKAGGLRTYLPGVVTRDAADAYRHRAMAPATIAGAHPRRLGAILRAGQVSRLEMMRLPVVLQAADYALLRESRRQPMARIEDLRARSVQANSGDDFAGLRALNNELVAQLELERSFGLDALERLYGVEDKLLDQNETVDILGLEVEDYQGQLEEARDMVGALRRRLRVVEAFEAADAPLVDAERTIYPDSFADLLLRLPEFAYLSYVGKVAHPLQLDEHPNIRPAVHKAWDALATLEDYARLSVIGSFTGGFTNYLEDPHHGGFNRMLNYKPTEGEVVQANPKLAKLRLAEIPGQGMMLITAHVGLLNRRAGAPRLYFEDRVATDGRIYIGYIGEHLLNAKLN